MSLPQPSLPARGFFLGCLLAGFALLPGRSAAGVQVDAAAGEEAIHAAVAALPPGGGVVELGSGTFLVTRPIILDRDGVELRGQGPGTRLQLAARANCPVVLIGSIHTPVERVVRRITVRQLTIDGNRTEQDYECYGGPCDERNLTALRNNGITIRGAADILVEDVLTRRARSGGVVLEKDCSRVRLNRLESADNEFDGVAAYESEDCEFTHLNLHHNRSAGFSFDWRFVRNRIADCVASDNGSQGIFMRDSRWNTFERVTLQRNGEQGVFIAETTELPGTACRRNRFIQVVITGNRAQGLRINDRSCESNQLVDSLVRDNRLEDISLAVPGLLEIQRPQPGQ